MSRAGPEIVALSVDPPLVELGGGVDVTVEYRNAVLIRLRRPDGVHHDFPAVPASGTQTFHITAVSGGDISVTALYPATATAARPFGESAPRLAPVRTYSLPPFVSPRLDDRCLGIPAMQIDAHEVHVGEPARTHLVELAQLRDGIASLPAMLPGWLPEPPHLLSQPPGLAALPLTPLALPADVLPQVLAHLLALPVSEPPGTI